VSRCSSGCSDPSRCLGALGLLFAKQGRPRGARHGPDMVNLGIFYIAQGRLPRRHPDLRLHRRRDDALPLRPHARRRRLLRLASWRPSAASVGPRSSALGLAASSPLPSRRVAFREPVGSVRSTRGRQRHRDGAADLRPYVWVFEITSRCSSPRPSVPWCWPTASGSVKGADPARAGTRRAQVSNLRRGLPAPVSTPATTRSTPRRCCPTARPSELSVSRVLVARDQIQSPDETVHRGRGRTSAEIEEGRSDEPVNYIYLATILFVIGAATVLTGATRSSSSWASSSCSTPPTSPS
jgi:hypothetical protein